MISSSDILHGKVLIVDDQEANIRLLERMLSGAGYVSISSTKDSNEVCDLHSKNRYDLILLDLEMPSLAFSGFQVMDRLKEIVSGGLLPVIVITAHPEHRLHALQAGARDFISKPFDLAEVLARVHNMLAVRLMIVEANNHIKELKQKVQEVEANRDLIRRQSDEIKRLYDKIVSIKGDAVEGGDAAALPQPQAPRAARLHTLLYVEDKPESLELVEQIIARHPDMRLLTAVNGKSGIELARASLPDVILTDINLPDISGFKVLEILRSDPATAHIPVIAVSANAMPLSIEKGMEAGFFHYITKPIKINDFMETLNVALEFAEQKVGQNK